MRITVDDILDAIEKNGVPQIFGSYYDYHESWTGSTYQPRKQVFGACAVGQASINLEIDQYHLMHFLNGLPGSGTNLGERIIKSNDNQKKSFKEIATYYRRRVTREVRSMSFEVPS